MSLKAHRILLVDDDFDQRVLSTRALKKVVSSRSSINLAESGAEAIAYMIGEGRFSDRVQYPFPTVVILDLNMMDGDGFELLEFMSANPGWRVVPRIVFSTSDDPDDIRTAYQLGASAYHLKAATLSETEAQVAQIVAYWSSTQIPSADGSGRLDRTVKSRLRGDRFPQADGGARMTRPKKAE